VRRRIVTAAWVLASLFAGVAQPQSDCPIGRAHRVPSCGVAQETIGETICVRSWTRRVRPPASHTEALKRRQIREFGYADRRLGDYIEDQIPLELGGDPSDRRNLWPQPKVRPAVGEPIARTRWSWCSTGSPVLIVCRYRRRSRRSRRIGSPPLAAMSAQGG
jgi:hypothetical protein